MMKAKIRLCYRKQIDSTDSAQWEKRLFESTYKEFYMQAQQFDREKKYDHFQEMLAHIPRADQMHGLVSTAAIASLKQLNGLLPDVHNAFGEACVPFQNFRFELLQSHMQDKKQHKFVIYFYSELLSWIDTLDGQLLLAMSDQAEAWQAGEEIETALVKLIPGLTISTIQSVQPIHQAR